MIIINNLEWLMMKHGIVFPFPLLDLNWWHTFYQTLYLSFFLLVWKMYLETFLINNDVWYIEGVWNNFYYCLHHDVLESLIETFLDIWNQHEYIRTCIISNLHAYTCTKRANEIWEHMHLQWVCMQIDDIKMFGTLNSFHFLNNAQH